MSQIQEQVIIYDLQLKQVARLENAFDISYDLRMNQAAAAQFSLPASDEKNRFCQGGYYAEIFDNGQRIDLFKITIPIKNWSDSEDYITYAAEHVINTLLDDVLFGLHSGQGGANGTASVIQYILGQQSQPHWVMGECDFSYQFIYDFENTTLKNALYTVPTQFGDSYLWATDTSTYPWKISLVQLNDQAQARIYYSSNLTAMEREVDYTRIYNRVYALGAGEGVNQLTIESVEPAGKKYVEDAASISRYGLKQYILTDRNYKNPGNLYAAAQSFLAEHQEPPITYKISAVDLSLLTGKSWDQFAVGAMVLVKNYDMRLPVKARIKRVSKQNVDGQPWNVSLELGNFVGSIASANNRLASQMNTEQTVSQGATNLCIINESDNADPEHPLLLKFYIPDTVINVNECRLNLQLDRFRAYTKTTSDGGGTTETTSTKQTVTHTTKSGDSNIVIRGCSVLPGSSPLTTTWAGGHDHNGEVSSVPNHYHNVHDHNHNVQIDGHTHELVIPEHSHTVTFSDHSHGINYGIYEENTLPTSVNIIVDGSSTFTPPSLNNIDLMSRLAKTGNLVRRGWHTVEISPNTIGRIVGALALQTYIQSRGNYVK